MAPLLRIGKFLKGPGWTRRWPFSLRRSKSESSNVEGSQSQRSHELRLGPDVIDIKSDAIAKHSESAVEDDDLVPLHSILVRRELVCEETRRRQEDNAIPSYWN